MILGIVISKNRVPIRLTDERWKHIATSHLEISLKDTKLILNTVENPDVILKGDTEELLAVQKRSGKKIWLVVAYREISQKDGFILTAYLTTDSSWLFQREIIWNKE